MNAGLGHAVFVLGLELAFWLVLGLAVVSWYDARKLYRLSPEIISYVESSLAQRAGR